ncbi:uncharacterized protein E0L32_001320 [Thyridium curvatum]|uniref:Uncharacterized protein n=1 Tax=Thyridium curvatum TaxID=1093900 RepID=A0A507AQQ7_9PEZI|nr:uncharacterized protein E0L32_001320 [Thyridium curvatum]TPX10123.1 hypothetical protein E0L32_001320 [Thyridium curvatum]
MASVASSAPDQRHLRLLAAAAQANESRVRDILAEEQSWTATPNDRDALRSALQRVAARGNIAVARLLLAHGAEVNPRRDGEVGALAKAAEAGHAQLAAELLRRGADPNGVGRSGAPVLFAACMRGHNAVVSLLLDAGADVDARDKEGRTPLLFLAAEKPGRWSFDTLRLLLAGGADIEARDHIERTPLLWAATHGNIRLVDALLRGELGKAADIQAANNRGRTSLHLAAEGNHEEMVELLLSHGADTRTKSDGGWTALHNAAQSGHLGVVKLLLDANAKVNAELSNGMTPLHWAAFNGHEEVVKLLLTRPDADLTTKDSFDRTPMLCAAETYNKDIVQLLSPARAGDRLSAAAQSACKSFEATIVDFGHFQHGRKQLVFKHSVHDLLYGWDRETDKPKINTCTSNIKYEPAFRWIHLPANNIAWVETLLAKHFVEGGHRDIEAFKALEKCFDQEHRGPLAHAHFMRTFCQRISASQGESPDRDREERSLASLMEDPSELSTISSQNSGAMTPRTNHSHGGGGHEHDSPKPDSKKSKSEQIAERHPKRSKRAKGPPGNPPKNKDNKTAANKGPAQVAWDTNISKLSSSNGKLVLFMPFLHFETDERRARMSNAIKSVRAGEDLPDTATRDLMLINAYLNNSPPLHPRRTLDQFFYHGIDTTARDRDQVVYRFCKRHHVEPKIYMVDQLWLWVLGRGENTKLSLPILFLTNKWHFLDLIITCFPQRWDQPRQDPLNVLDGIIEETNAKTRPPMQSVYDLAMLITNRCSGMFDRHRLDDQDYQFLDMFESSIGHVTNRESQLFLRFNRASDISAQLLQHNRRHRRRASRQFSRDTGGRIKEQDPLVLDALLDIGIETALLAEIKDIRDELNIIAVILDSQSSILHEFEGQVVEELRTEGGGGGGGGGGGTRRVVDAVAAEIRKRSREQKRLLEVHRKDVERMDRQAESIYMSLTHLLDLKQKHSNALEARFARDQAEIAARQGQTIMVFTIVTIVFLPMSFIAAFFAINFREWDDGRLTLAYVSKYMFGIGLGISIPLVAMAFTVNDIFDAVRGVLLGVKDAVFRRDETSKRRTVDEALLLPEEPSRPRLEAYPSSRGRPSLADDAYSGRVRARQGGYLGRGVSYEKSYEGHGLGTLPSPTRAPGARKFSLGSGNAVSWMRPSYDRSKRRSEDLENGRSEFPGSRSPV